MRDVISGFFLIVEDQVRVGDSAVVNGQGGLVEQVNLRTIVLRDETGTVHVFPNGEVKTLANMSKDFAYYVVTIGLAYDADVDRAVEAMQTAASGLMDDPDFRPHILAPLEVYGVDAFEQGQLVIKARIKTVPQQAVAGRARAEEAHSPRIRRTRHPDGRAADDGAPHGTSGGGGQCKTHNSKCKRCHGAARSELSATPFQQCLHLAFEF